MPSEAEGPDSASTADTMGVDANDVQARVALQRRNRALCGPLLPGPRAVPGDSRPNREAGISPGCFRGGPSPGRIGNLGPSVSPAPGPGRFPAESGVHVGTSGSGRAQLPLPAMRALMGRGLRRRSKRETQISSMYRAASSTESVTSRRSRSDRAIMPASTIVSNCSTMGRQYSTPITITGNSWILAVWMRVSASNLGRGFARREHVHQGAEILQSVCVRGEGGSLTLTNPCEYFLERFLKCNLS